MARKNILDLTENLSSFYKQKKTYKALLKVVEPVKEEISKTLTAHESEDDLNSKSHFGYFIPMKESLENLLSLIPIKSLYASKISTEKIKKDIFDGNEIKKQMQNENRLAIVFYVDDVEVGNPIGPHKKKHKLSKKFNIQNK